MFSGLVADLGRVESIATDDDGARIRLKTDLAGEIAPGDSVAVNGVCLTATEVTDSGFAAEAMIQTLNLTSLGGLGDGAAVNLELALRADQRLGGHFVQGHVDGVGRVVSLTEDGFSLRVTFSIPENLSNYVVPQGSITLEGVSLTVTDCGGDWAEVALIPETRERTSLGQLAVDQAVNVECDVIAKYVERMVSPYAGRTQPAESEQ
ncbi:MAG: riboflavin synthase [Solirubrobacterales bacterium]